VRAPRYGYRGPACEFTVVRYLARLVGLALTRIVASAVRVLSFDCEYPRREKQWLVNVIRSDGAELQQVNTNIRLSVRDLQAVFAAAPRLQVLNAGVIDYCTALIPVLRNEPPFGQLRVSELFASFQDELDNGGVLALAAAVAAHESLKVLNIQQAHLARGVNAMLDAAAERQVSRLQIHRCNLDADTVPALARLLQRGSLTSLVVDCFGFPEAPEESVLELWAALRSCRTLEHVKFVLNPPENVTRRVVAELLNAAASLPALSELSICASAVQDKVDAGRALGVLLGANLPSLRILRVSDCALGDEALAPLLDGLAVNTHLRELDCQFFNSLSEPFMRDRLRPALTALMARAQLDA
jgi:hypothetical protein